MVKLLVAWRYLLPLGMVLGLYILPTPAGLSDLAWLYFSVFMGMVLGMILEPIPASLVAVISIVVCVVLRIGPSTQHVSAGAAITWGLSGFANKTVWLVFIAFMLGLGYEKSGLGRRIALWLIRLLGKTTLGLGYAVALADLVLAPFIPSNSARSGGILYPIVSNIPPLVGSFPDKEPHKIGTYLIWTGLATTCITSSMFFTALAPNLLAMESAFKSHGIEISWVGWFLAFLPAGITLFLLTPYLAYKVCKPTLKGSKDACIWAKQELNKMGTMGQKEYLMLGLSVFTLILWIGGKHLNIQATTTALLSMVLMVLFGIIKWKDVVSNHAAFNIFFLFGGLITLASGLKSVGFLEYIGHLAQSSMTHLGLSGTTMVCVLIAGFYLSHYLFASVTAHVSALLVLFMSMGAGVMGVELKELALLLMLTLGIMGILTPYGTGPSLVWYGSNYIKSAEFWKYGLLFGLLNLSLFLSLCVPWIKFIAFRWLG
ncbi:DASS family sodium-coupled anion symporter [Helicobacter baculiformis]|uniref:DASS family sodium-coupled anion symporter n=1 Tax=Helicobacter baculiformis TaxID=427351 RepID=A0ABV7ZJZ9_9HELI|nr:DASS family sodium-coupled anion symporter [Helicobacter baculiformis]